MIASSPSGARAPSRLLRISLRRPRPAPAAPSLSAATASARSSSVERIGLRSLTTSSSGISVLAQWMAPAPMQNSARPRPEAEQLGRQADLPEHLVAGGVRRLDREVGDDEQQRAERRQPEQGGDLALAAVRGLGVDVGAAVDVRRQPGVAVAWWPARPGDRRRSRGRCPLPRPTSPRRPSGRCSTSRSWRQVFPARCCVLRARPAGSLIVPSPPARRRSRSGRRCRPASRRRPRTPARSCPGPRRRATAPRQWS